MRFGDVLGDKRCSSAGWWPERLAAFAALAGLVLGSLPGYDVAGWQDSGSDFKTLYASAKCFVAGRRAYSFENIGTVFRAGHVVLPGSWYAHAPTYPPFTFALLAPLTYLPMVSAVYAWLILSAAALVFAIMSMSHMAEGTFELGRGWRLLLIVLVTASPVVSFGLQIGNVSVIASVLCILAVMSPDEGHASWRAVALTVSLFLKPHIALWLLVAMFLSRNREDRALVLRTVAYSAAATLCASVWFSIHLPYGLQLKDYTQMVTSEIATGCLNPRNHELLPPVAEVTSLESLFGFFLASPWMQLLSGSLLFLTGAALTFLSRLQRSEDSGARLEMFGAWSTFGLLVTYHRTHDAIILFLMLPWILWRLRRRRSDGVAWGVLLLGLAMSLGGFPPSFDWVSNVLGFHWLSQFLVFRQSAISTLLLMVLLLVHLIWEAQRSAAYGRVPNQSARDVPAGELQIVRVGSRS